MKKLRLSLTKKYFSLSFLQNHHLQRTVKSSKLDDYSQFNDDSSITQQQHQFQHKEEEETFKMSQDCGSTCAKYILCAFNFVFFVSFRVFFPISMTPTNNTENKFQITQCYYFSLSPIYIDSRISRAWAWPLAVIRQKLDSSTAKHFE